MKTTHKQITGAIRELSDEERARHSMRFFKTGKGEYGEGDKFLGIRVPVIRAQAKKFKEVSLKENLKLLRSEFHEERLCSLIIMIHKFSKGNENERTEIFRIYMNNTKYINNWDLVDLSAPHIVGAFLFDKERTPIYELSESADLWKRRIAILSTFHFIKRLQFEDALNLSEEYLRDKEDLIHKAVGWMLREIGNRNIAVEKEFLGKHYKIMPRTMLRYAIEKFPEIERKAYLLGKI